MEHDCVFEVNWWTVIGVFRGDQLKVIVPK